MCMNKIKSHFNSNREAKMNTKDNKHKQVAEQRSEPHLRTEKSLLHKQVPNFPSLRQSNRVKPPTLNSHESNLER